MRILIEAHHPAHIHFFKNAARIWCDRGDEVLMLGRDRDVMAKLLTAYDWIPHKLLTSQRKNNRIPFAELLQRQGKVGSEALKFRPDVLLSVMGSYAQTAWLLRVPNIVFTDSERQSFNHTIAHPFATRIYTPECFWKDLGSKQRKYRGYHELAFLHPNRFTPRHEVLQLLGGVRAHEYIIIRVSEFNTLHDIGKSGFGDSFDRFVTEANEQYRVFLVPEGGKLPAKWEHLRFSMPPDYFHDALAFARFVVTEGASTASECAMLGIPSIYVNPTVHGYCEDLERRGLMFIYREPEPALRKMRALLKELEPRDHWQRLRQDMLGQHIDVTGFIVNEMDDLLRRK
jgi:predicted glycosyltransferase